MFATFRTILFYIMATIWTIFSGLAGLPLLLTFQPKIIGFTSYLWSVGTLFLLRYICGVKIKEIGRQNIPSKPFIVASKHQSVFETIFLLKRFFNSSFILKKELQYIPIYGWYLPAMGMIGIDRNLKSAIKQIIRGVERLKKDNRVIIIFPEGTRTEVGQHPEYKNGIYYIQKATKLSTLPIALNSGKLWCKSRFAILPGTVTVQYLPAINHMEDRDTFMHELKNSIEHASLLL